MKNKLLLFVSLLSISFTMQSQEPLSVSIAAQQSFTPTNYVTDLGDFYTPEQEDNLNKIISDYEKKTSIEIGVLTVESLGDNSIEEYANTQFNRIGVGKKGADNGILIVFAMNDRKSRIETGNGMEPFLTDLDTHDALDVVKPYFRNKEYANGTEACIGYITNKLGNQAFANKVQWLKERKAKQEKAEAAQWASFWDGLIKFALAVAFIGILVFIYFLDKARREKIRQEQEKIRLEELRLENVKKNITLVEKYLKSVNVYQPSFESVIAKSSFDTVSRYIKTLNLDRGISTDDEYLNKLNSLKNTTDSKVNSYNKLVSDIENDIKRIKSLDYSIMDAKSCNSSALSCLSQIQQYGYHKNYKDLSSEISRLEIYKNEIIAMLSTDVDGAINKSKNFKLSIDSLTNESNSIKRYLSEIQEAEKAIKSSESLFASNLNNINQYKKYLKDGEVQKVQSEFENFRKKSSNATDYLSLVVTLTAVMALTSGLYSTVRKRKSDEEAEEQRKKDEERRKKRREEEEEDRRRRNSYSSSSSSSSYGSSWGSSSSSDSGSSFGGFDGGSSSGGGSSSDW